MTKEMVLKGVTSVQFYCIIALILVVFLCFHFLTATNYKARECLLSLREKIQIGNTANDVISKLNEDDNCSLDVINQIDNSKRIIVKTPLEFGAKNWILLVNFKEEKVTSLKIRTEDSETEKPNEAPNDKQ